MTLLRMWGADKERRFCARMGIEIVAANVADLLQEWNAELATS